MSNDPKKWSIEVRLMGNELSLILDALEELGGRDACHFVDSNKPKEIDALIRKLTAKWEVNA